MGNPNRAATGVCRREQQFNTHSNTDMDPTKGLDSTETAGQSRGQGPTWGSVKPKNLGSFSARGQGVKESQLQPVEGREEVGLPGGSGPTGLQSALGLRYREDSSQGLVS